MVPDVDGRMVEDFAVAVPAAVGGGTAAGRVISTDLAKDLMFSILSQVQLEVRVTLAVAWCEAKMPYPVNLDKGQIKLKREKMRDVWGL